MKQIVSGMAMYLQVLSNVNGLPGNEKDVFSVELVGPKCKVAVAYLQDAAIAKPYTEDLTKATDFPLNEVILGDKT